MSSCDLTKTFIREWENSSGSVLSIHQLEVGDVGCVVWDAALVLSAYLSTQSFKKLVTGCGGEGRERVRIVELGAGTGVVGIQAATLNECYDVLVTDLPELVLLINKNISENQHLMKGSIQAESLCWGQDKVEKACDVVLMADCIYYEEVRVTDIAKLGTKNSLPRMFSMVLRFWRQFFQRSVFEAQKVLELLHQSADLDTESLVPLVTTLLDLSDKQTIILCCYEARTEGKNPQTEQRFFKLVQEHFTMDEIPLEDQDENYRSPDIHIMLLRRKSS